ncbi:MAG: tRNA (N(6)-L-threonylcarbamoyladenosine(37)-C(2))-methylthiotransferase MtaB [Candidatus Marinimicrobia bacterium]|nr:tRNA (N(6)-L-threonylcarbamoyladenosine(37)-C(2))-methylthiotransferase MtaB [Candidatus Neomarinimicrobiota bacterium]MCH8069316.1 tRNA (N(6)-L-threonylcarbamoyladenosine(37)-C(2))-methylthiotransferase MtaB [Candidatus Neomarinimicrobiota bacterium]
MTLKLQDKKVAFYTLGCKLNFAETSTIARDLYNNGFKRVDFSEPADLYVINTCSVTGQADSKCRKIIRQAIGFSPGAFIAVTGCYAQLKPGEIAQIPGVDLVLGAGEKFNLTNHFNSLKKRVKSVIHSCEIKNLNTFIPSYSTDERTRTFLKIQDGCDYSCSFCTIPLARGKSRSESISHILNTAKEISANGTKEIVLTGVNIGDFGAGRGESFFDLIQELDRIERIRRFRVSSIEPNLLSDEIIAFVANSQKFVPHFHISLQSGSNKILKLMRRRYQKELFANTVNKIKSLIPNCCIGVDVIVGFPSETDEDFMETYNFIEGLDVSYLHVFTYSERPNTIALEIPGLVPNVEKNKRSRILHILSDNKRRLFYDNYIGKTLSVLFESNDQDLLNGFTKNYIKVRVPGLESLLNEIRDVKLLENQRTYVIGDLSN